MSDFCSSLVCCSACVSTQRQTNQQKAPVVANHVIPAIEGFFRSIMLQRSGDNTRQDVLRLLQLLLTHGTRRDVDQALQHGINTVSIDNWLHAIPQIIARIHTPHNSIRKLLHDLLSKIGRAHPQALVYPLTVASKSQSPTRYVILPVPP